MKQSFKEFLDEQDYTGLYGEVLRDLEEYDTKEDAISYLKDVLNHGCVSGVVCRLICYKDTNDFYDEWEEEIEQILEEFRDNCGYKNRVEAISNLNGADSVGSIEQEKNLLSWMAYEETARKVLNEVFEIEY